MKTGYVSSSAISQAIRYSMMRMQNELVKGQKEVSTGKVADAGLTLGARTTQTVTFARDMQRLNGIIDSNALISSRLDSTQEALTRISEAGQSFLSTLTGSASGDAGKLITQSSAQATLDALTAILNTSLNGEHLFAGVNTDVKPINDFSAAGSPNKAAFDAAFLAHFGFTQNDPAASNITGPQMTAFLAAAVEPQFLGAGWQTNWSNATDQRIVGRIALNETTETSVSANHDGIRKLAMAAATIADLMSSNVGEAAKTALVNEAITLVGSALGDIANLQAETGIVQKRVDDASQRIAMQADLFEKHLVDLEGVDPYEASTRVADLLSHIETSYALTARIQQLSLLRFLG